MSESSVSTRKTIAAERARRALALRLEGRTLAEIGADLGVQPSTAMRALKRSLAKVAEVTAEMSAELREQERERLDALITKTHPMLSAEDPIVRLKAIDTAAKLSARMSALYGLDGPTKIQAEMNHDARGELADLIARITARAGASGDAGEPESGGG